LAFIIQRELAADARTVVYSPRSIQTAFAVYVLQNYSTTRLQTSIKGGLNAALPASGADYINANLEEDLRVNEIAALAGKSDYHFTRLFKQSTGLPVYRYVQEQRIKLAQRLLADRNLTVTEIAYRAGFASHSRFTELFPPPDRADADRLPKQSVKRLCFPPNFYQFRSRRK
jgi:AraC-like DNA-binding protein